MSPLDIADMRTQATVAFNNASMAVFDAEDKFGRGSDEYLDARVVKASAREVMDKWERTAKGFHAVVSS